VIGLDAMSWNVIEPLISDGKLPTIKRLIENGIWGNLESCIYFFTSPAWKCYSTGKNPGKLGAIENWIFDKVEKKLSLISSLSFKSKELWDILGEHGYKCGIVNMPFAYPLKNVNGVLVAGILSPERGYTYPRELEKLLQKYDYRIYPKIDILVEREKALLERMELIKKRFLISSKLIEEFDFDFFQLVVFSTDEIQHYYWRQMEEGDIEYGNVINHCWELVDTEIGKLLRIINEECHIFIVSDHGATALKRVFGLNIWLRLNGYLSLKHTPLKKGILNIISGNILYKFMNKKILQTIKTYFSYQTLIRFTQQQHSEKKRENTLIKNINWEKTKAICIGQNSIYITTNKNYDIVREKIIDDIKDIKNPLTGECIVEDVKKKEEIFKGEYLDMMPDLIIVPKMGYRLFGYPLRGSTRDIWDFPRKPWSGYHKLHGTIIASGPNIKKGKGVDKVTIYDVAPTILHIFGVPVPREIDGQVLKDIFKENSNLANKSVVYEIEENHVQQKDSKYYSEEEEQLIIKRLKDLGYV
jgi:predicted AlkP superfamily phosphohydrolase/phosphomutase